MRTTKIRIDGQKREALLIAGGRGFKVYSVSGLDGWVLAIGKTSIVVPETDPHFKTVARYVNLKYQPLNLQDSIKASFEELVATHANKDRPARTEADL